MATHKIAKNMNKTVSASIEYTNPSAPTIEIVADDVDE